MVQRKESQQKASAIIEEKHVKYIGLSDIRIIRKSDWKMINIEHEDVVWDRRNNFTVPANDLSKEVLNYCQHDPELIIVSQ